MKDDDSLLLWRLASELSVVDAALLLAGANPSEFEALRGLSTYDAVRTGAYSVPDETPIPSGFDAAFAALKAAIHKGGLRAQLSYSLSRGWHDTEGLRLVTTADLKSITFHGAEGSLPEGLNLTFQREPHWGKSMLDVDDLRAWLRLRGVRTGFFFAEPEAAPDDFLNPAHDHFSPELALAVSAWMGLAGQHAFKRGVKAAIEDWIAANPDAWQSSELLSESAKERVATVANWRPKGGLPKSGS